jgi:hypothetical protein
MGAYGSYGPVQRSAKKEATSTHLPVEAAFLPSAPPREVLGNELQCAHEWPSEAAKPLLKVHKTSLSIAQEVS